MGGPLTGVLRRRGATVLLAATGSLLCLAALAPLLSLVPELLAARSAGLSVWSAPRTWELLARSLVLATGITTVSLLLGVPLGVLFGRTDVFGRRVAWLLHAFGMFLPPFLLALGWFHVFGRGGWLGTEASSAALFSTLGVVAILGIAFAPVVTSLVALAVINVDRSLQDAARVAAGPWRVATRILVPAAWPAVALGGIVVFALAISELGVPMFLRVDVFQAAVFARLGGIDHAPGEALALAAPLLALSLVLFGCERWLVGKRIYSVLGLHARSDGALPLGRWRVPVTMACWMIALLSIAPVIALSVRAFAGDVVPAFEWAARSPANSLLTAALAATGILLLGLVIGHAAARRLRGAAWLDGLALFAFVTPAPVLGVGLIKVWNQPATQLVYGTFAMLVIALIARYCVVGVRVFATATVQIPRALEDAAAVAGATYIRRFLKIVLPIGRRGAVFAWLLALVFCLRDLETAVLFYPPGGEPLTVRIFTLEANGPEAIVAGLGALHAAMTAMVLIAAWILLFARRVE